MHLKKETRNQNIYIFLIKKYIYFSSKNIYISKLYPTLKSQQTAHLGGPTAFLAAETHTVFHAGRELWRQATTSDLHLERRLMDNVFIWENPMSLPIHIASFTERVQNLKANHNELPPNELIQIMQTTIEASTVAPALTSPTYCALRAPTYRFYFSNKMVRDYKPFGHSPSNV